MQKASDIFEGPESTLKQAFDGVAIENWDFPEAQGAKAKPRVHFAGESTCVNCEG